MPSAPPNRAWAGSKGHWFQPRPGGDVRRVGHHEVDGTGQFRKISGDVGSDDSTAPRTGVAAGGRPAPRRRRPPRSPAPAASGEPTRSPAHRTGTRVHDQRIGGSDWASAHSSNASVSGRGMNTPGPTQRERAERRGPVMLQRDSAGTRGDQFVVAAEELGVGVPRRPAGRASVPAAWAASSSASVRAESIPAWASAAVATSMVRRSPVAVIAAAAGLVCRRRRAHPGRRRGHRRAPGRGCAP